MKLCTKDGCDTKHFGKGLCQKHYNRVHRRERRDSSDVAYQKWLNTTPRVDAEIVKPWIEALVNQYENVNAAAKVARVDERIFRGVLAGERARVMATTAEDIAVATGRMVELAMALPDTGEDGWSEYGRYCGDGCPIGHPGCGSWFHKPGNYGLCEECTGIALGLLDMDTRDVRMSKEIRG